MLSKIPVNKTTLCSEIATLIGSLAEYVDTDLPSVSGSGFIILMTPIRLDKFMSLIFIDSNLKKTSHLIKSRKNFTSDQQ